MPMAFVGEKVTTFFLSDALGRCVRVFWKKPLTANHANCAKRNWLGGPFLRVYRPVFAGFNLLAFLGELCALDG
jgi:hypothetical protein